MNAAAANPRASLPRTPRRAAIALAASALAAIATPAHANPTNLVTNGSFENFTAGGASGSCTSTQTITNNNPTDWDTTSGYTFVVNASNYSSFCGPAGSLGLYGPITASPDGGNFLADDSVYQVGYVYQAISNLVPGATYALTFYMAAAQQTGYTGATTDYFNIGLGLTAGATDGPGSSGTTPTFDLPSQTFSGWVSEEVNLFAATTSEVLWFLAGGTPSGEPPFALLDGLDMEITVPEPPAAALLLVGVLALAGLRRHARTPA